MCGINGIYGLNDSLLAKERVNAMNFAMKHRGPDDDGIFTENNIALGHRRLSIIDLSTAGHQPMHSEDGRYHLVFNGEIYNYKELKFELQRVTQGNNESSYIFKTNTDSEVIIAAYIRWGQNCVQHFNGMFAFAIWDSEKNELFVARDRIGIKPLYYFFNNGVFAFSSEIRSLLASQLIPKKLDHNSIVDYLRYQTVHAPNTLIKGVKMLMPGSYIYLQNSEFKIKTYWNLQKNISFQNNEKTYTEICADVNNLLTKSVERRLIADVPFGAFLSGGIDSSAIVGLMSKVSTEKVKSFSVTFDESEFSEAKYAQLIAKKFNTEHHEIKLKPDYFLKQLPFALSAMDHPSGDGPNTYIVSQATKEAGITMALSGLGGDELFAGYHVFNRALQLQKKNWINFTPRPIRKIAGQTLLSFKKNIEAEKVYTLLKQNKIDFNHFYPINRQVLMDETIEKLINTNIPITANAVAEIINHIDIIEKNYIISKTSIAEISTYMQNVLLRDTDQMSMAHALEVRVPFLDYTLVEYVLGLNDKNKYPISPKKLLIDSLGDLLPNEIVNRPKMGFTLPWNKWMKNELKNYCNDKISSLANRNIFNRVALTNHWNSFLKGDKKISWSRIWYLVVLEQWIQDNDIET
jgi:asparagine synthase (glutamine-hydrolysing)